MPYVDIRDGREHDDRLVPVLFHNTERTTQTVRVPVTAPLAWTNISPDASVAYDTYNILGFTVAPGMALYADGAIAPPRGERIPPNRPERFYVRGQQVTHNQYDPPRPTPGRENTVPLLSEETPASPTPITTLDEAAAALARFQEVLSREAESNGHPRAYAQFVQRAIAEVPGLRAVPREQVPVTGTVSLALRITVPDANPSGSRSDVERLFRHAAIAWANENGHENLNETQKIAAYVLAHPEMIMLEERATTAYLDEYSISTNRTGDGAVQARVEFVRGE